jgi:predicted nucleic acid-binding protein
MSSSRHCSSRVRRGISCAVCPPRPSSSGPPGPLLRELAATLAYQKLAAPVAKTGLPVEDLVESYAGQTLVVPDEELTAVPFPADPSDAAVLAAARAARVEWLVTGDRHLLDAQQLTFCSVLRVTEALARAAQLLAKG